MLNTENCERRERSISEVVGGGAELTTKRYGEDVDGRTDERGDERKTDFLARDDANQRWVDDSLVLDRAERVWEDLAQPEK